MRTVRSCLAAVKKHRARTAFVAVAIAMALVPIAVAGPEPTLILGSAASLVGVLIIAGNIKPSQH